MLREFGRVLRRGSRLAILEPVPNRSRTLQFPMEGTRYKWLTTISSWRHCGRGRRWVVIAPEAAVVPAAAHAAAGPLRALVGAG